MPTALQIEPNGQMEAISLSGDPALRRRAVTTRLGDSVADRAVYHPKAVMWVHGSGARSLPANVAATALASAWRGQDIGADYFLHGPAIITATDEDADLPEDLVRQARAVVDAIGACARLWRTTPPASDEAAWAEIIERAFALAIGPHRAG